MTGFAVSGNILVVLERNSGSRLAVEEAMVPGIRYAFKCFKGTLGVIEELKSHCGCRGLAGK